jgi:hypothetical protein
MIKSVYGLYYSDPTRGPVVFYVGCTNDINRRLREHKRAFCDPNGADFDTFKYQFCRDLQSLGITFDLHVIEENVEMTDDDEYHWILKLARHNESEGIAFYDNLPLTNMRAGDFLEEMMRDQTVKTVQDIRQFRQLKSQARRVSTYQRANANSSIWNPAGRQIIAQLEAGVIEQRKKQAEREQKRQVRQTQQRKEHEAWLAQQQALWEIGK